MRIVTWNVNSLKARLDRVEQWMRVWEPDVVCIQETKLADDAFPALTFQAMGYEAAHHGQGRWNGVAILSRVGLDDVRIGFADDEPEDEDARLLWATCGGVRVGNVYVPNGRALDDDHYAYKLRFLDRLQAVLEHQEAPDSELMLTGDFNIAPTDLDVHDPAQFTGTTHTSEAERKALAGIEAWGTTDLFRRMYDAGDLYSWWDYRGGDFHKRKGMRIDLMMTTAPLTNRLSAMLIDREERKPTGNAAGGKPSDHAPVVADFG